MQNNKAAHSALRLSRSGKYIQDDNAIMVGELYVFDGTGERIVTACNHHDELVSMVRDQMSTCYCRVGELFGATPPPCPKCARADALLHRIEGGQDE